MTLSNLRTVLEASTVRLHRAMQSTATLYGLAREATGLCTVSAEAPARVQGGLGK